MKNLKETSSTDALVTSARVHTIRLKSNPATEPLAPPTEAVVTELKSADALYQEALVKRMVLTGQLNYADSVLDDLVMGASRKVLDLVAGDRTDQRYRAVFAISPSDGTEDVASPAQDRFVSNVIVELRKDADASLSALADPIDAAQAEVMDIRAKRDAAYAAEGNASNALRLARVRLIDNIRGNQPRLQIIFPKKKRVVRSFFL
jgi:hypothetical protein